MSKLKPTPDTTDLAAFFARAQADHALNAAFLRQFGSPSLELLSQKIAENYALAERGLTRAPIH